MSDHPMWTVEAGPIEDDLAVVTDHDRRQGGAGLARAAEAVAERAERAGLAVDLRWYRPGDQWWTYRAPAAGSPVSARLQVLAADGPRPVTSYPEVPYALARGSGSTVERIVPVARSDVDPVAGALVLIPPGTADPAEELRRLAAAGAVGVAFESAGRPNPDAIDRWEVDDDCPLVAFSVSTAQARCLDEARDRGDRVVVEAAHTEPAPMPLVHGRAGDEPGPLLVGHLCHPGPGANDNASGVAALLAVARAAGNGLGLTFLWAPEMVGTAAYLHDVVGDQRPEYAISLDTVGSPQSTLVIEAPPAHLGSPLAAALQVAAEAVSPPARSYSGVVELPTWAVELTPFVGASDHLLLADPAIGVPAAQLGNWPDPYRHTSLDDLSRVAPDRIARVARTVLTAVTALRGGTDAMRPTLDRVLRLALAQLAQAVHRCATEQPRDGFVSAYAPGACRRTVLALSRDADLTLHGIGRCHPELAGRAREHRRRLRDVTAAMVRVLPPRRALPWERPLARRWDGPWNLRAFLTAAKLDAVVLDAADLRALRAAGPAGYAWMTALAQGLDGTAGPQALLERASVRTGLAIPRDQASRFLEALVSSGWAGPP